MPSKKEKKNSFTEEELALMAIGFVKNKEFIKNFETQNKEYRAPIEEYAIANGKKLPTGSTLTVLSHADVDIHLKRTLKVSQVLLPEASDIIKENHLEDCIETVEVIREDVLERLYDAGKISPEVLQRLYAPKESWAFSVELKKKSGHEEEE